MGWHLFRAFAVALFLSQPLHAESVLADLAEAQKWEALAEALAKPDVAVNAAQPDGTTALHWAAYHDHLPTAQALLKAGAKPNLRNRYDALPLGLACINGNGDLVSALLTAGAQADASHSQGEPLLHTAARTGKVYPIQYLLNHGAEIDKPGPGGQTALMWAAAEGHADAVRRLLKHGANPKAKVGSDFTAMLFAARNGREEVVAALLEYDVDPNFATDYQAGGNAPPKGTSALRLAVENGHFGVAVKLLEAGADPNDQQSGFTPLHVLTWVRKPNRGDGKDGMPPPKGSGKLTSLEFAELLITKYGAEVNTQLRRGSTGSHKLGTKRATAFLMASKTADLPYLKLLHGHGADPTISNEDGTLPLMTAAGLGTHAPTEEAGTEEEALATVAWLLEIGCPLNSVNERGDTAMHGAAYKSLPKMVLYLDEMGADPKIWNQPNKRSRTPYHIALGYRPGNFKPAPATAAAFKEVFRNRGIDVKKLPPPKGQRDAYSE